MDGAIAQAAARICLRQYDSLPPRGAKPGQRTDGRREWTVLSGLLLHISSGPSAAPEENLHLIALATGVKCSPLWFLHRLRDEVNKVEVQDSSMEEARQLDGLPFVFEQIPGERRWRLNESVRVIWFISTLPCGDASTSHLLASRAARFGSQSLSDQADESEGCRTSSVASTATSLRVEVARGRANQTALSTLRTKPGRADCLPAVSHSCSDKLASYVALGLQGTLLSSLVEPITPSVFVIGFEPNEPHPSSVAEQGSLLQEECTRALWGRLASFLALQDQSEWRTTQPKISMVPSLTFVHSRETVEREVRKQKRSDQEWEDIEPVPAAGAIVWTRSSASKGRVENVVAGLKMGASSVKKKAQEGLPLHPSRRSTLCKLNWYQVFRAAAEELLENESRIDMTTYFASKNCSSARYARQHRRRKLLLRGWPAQLDDVESELQRQARQVQEKEQVTTFINSAPTGAPSEEEDVVTSPTLTPDVQGRNLGTYRPDSTAPFYGWLVLGSQSESFNVEGMLEAVELQ
ncbi:hypothetical protein OC835_001356 [Tilletia horrida]|nr:hypothetical protein OC835_001356 [Tilletia horrida]